MKIRKAIITAAGWGTRFLPVTRSQPKEMIPLVDKPVIQYVVEEAVSSGIEQIVLVTAVGKEAVEGYFDRFSDLERFLEERGETQLLEQMRALSNLADIGYVRQEERLGLGHAILTAKEMIDREPFAVLLPDDIIDSKVPVLKQMLDFYEQCGTSVIAVERIHPEDAVKYGVIKPEKHSDHTYRVLDLVEKPEPAEAPSNLGVVGRYILMPEVLDILKRTKPGKHREIQLTDALKSLLKEQPVYAYEFEGTRFDVGTPAGWLRAIAALALKHPDYRAGLSEYLRELL